MSLLPQAAWLTAGLFQEPHKHSQRGRRAAAGPGHPCLPPTSYSCTEAKCCAIFMQYVATEESSCSSRRCTAFLHWRAAMAASMAFREQLGERRGRPLMHACGITHSLAKLADG